MGRHRFYAPPTCIVTSTVTLPREETHHLAQVLRLESGDEVYVFDGCGREYLCRVERTDGGMAHLQILETLLDRVESPLQLTLAQGLMKGERFDSTVQKATELGVTRIIPLSTKHSVVRLSTRQSDERVARWRRISLESLKQCGRRTLVEIAPITRLGDFLGSPADQSAAVLVFSERGGIPLSSTLAGIGQPSTVIAVIGPEGGWSTDELTSMAKRGWSAVTLGPRVLRAETAPVVVLTLLQHALGDLSIQESRDWGGPAG